MRDERSDLDARADTIFDRALDLPRDERAAFLDSACEEDRALRARLDRLLAFSDAPPTMLDRAATVDWWPPERVASTTTQTMPTRVGPYRLLSEVGRGGMGVVYLGVRDDGFFEQQVAIKVMRPGADAPEVRRRFEQERQIIASLQHANIARLYDGGVTDDGRPYSAMELVDGKPITVYCEEKGASIAERVRLMEVVGRAVQHAHQNLVVHCDLKPSNILVTDSGEIKLLDFGIAKLLDAAGAERVEAAGSDSRGLTPLYASPEQLRGEPMTTASDVYQLGLLLFELLTGSRARSQPTTGSRRDDGGLETAPVPAPSVAAERAGATAIARRLRGDLDGIVLAALESSPERRYPSVAALVSDLERSRRHEPVSVRRPTLRYRAGRFVRRNRLSVAIGAALVLLLIGYSITVTVQARNIARERDRAERLQAFALEIFSAGDPNASLGPRVSAADLVAHGVARAEDQLAGEPDAQAEVKSHLGKIYLRLGLHHEAETLFRQVLALRRQLHDEPHVDIATAQNELGRLLLESDDAEALTLLESALVQRRELLGDAHPDTARTLTHLGYYLRSAGRRQAAEAHFREALALQRRHRPGSVDEAHTLQGLAWTVRFMGRPEEAEPMMRQALEILRGHFEEGHPEVAKTWNDLATVLWQLERWPEGDHAIRRSIASKKLLHGDKHPSIATSLGNHAGSLRRRGELERAEALYRQAFEMRREIFDPRHPRVAQSLAQLAEVLTLRGQPQRAEPLFHEAMSIFREHLAPDHPSLGRVWRGLGGLHLEAGRLAEARAALSASRAVYVKVDASPWPWRLDVMLAEIDRRQGRPADAKARLADAEGKLGDHPEWTARWRREMTELRSE